MTRLAKMFCPISRPEGCSRNHILVSVRFRIVEETPGHSPTVGSCGVERLRQTFLQSFARPVCQVSAFERAERERGSFRFTRGEPDEGCTDDGRPGQSCQE